MGSPPIIGVLPRFLTFPITTLSDILTVITILIYILVLVVIGKNRKDETLKHDFFSLTISLGIADIMKILTTTFLAKLAIYGWVPEFFIWLGSWGSRLTNLAGCFRGAQIAGILIVALNRFSAVMLPVRHQLIWNSTRALRYCIVLQWLFGLSNTIPVFAQFDGFYNTIAPDNRTITFAWKHASNYTYIVFFLQYTPMIVITIILYTVIFASTMKNQCANNRTLSATERLSIKMTLIGFIHVLGILMLLSSVLCQDWAWRLFAVDLFEPETFWFISDECNVFFSCVNPYALLLFCSPVRKYFLEMFKKPPLPCVT